MSALLPHSPRSLRGRLTLSHALVVGLALVGFTLGVYGLLARGLSAEIDRSLAERAEQVNGELQRGRPPARPRRFVVRRANTLASPDIFVQVVALNGRVLGASTNLEGSQLPKEPAALRALRQDRQRYSTVTLDGERLRVYTAPLSGRSGRGGIQVARSLEPLQSSLARLRLYAGLGLLVALALSGLIVWGTTTAALHPLESLIETAEAVGTSGDLTRRVAPPASVDEVGRLATTFNRMLERLKASDDELREAYSRLEASLRSQRRFVADASHELRTPLTTVRGNASLLRQFSEVTPEDREAALSQISSEADRMSRLVEDLLTLARADAGQPLARVRVALGPLLEDVVSQARRLTTGQSICVKALEQVEVLGNPDALRQLVLIMLDNAIKYTPQGGQISVKLDGDGSEARLTVADTGRGIAPGDLPHIFARFYRADHSRGAGGAGLGLAIAHWVVDEHRGSIEAGSGPGEGATFTVRIPRAPD